MKEGLKHALSSKCIAEGYVEVDEVQFSLVCGGKEDMSGTEARIRSYVDLKVLPY